MAMKGAGARAARGMATAMNRARARAVRGMVAATRVAGNKEGDGKGSTALTLQKA